MAAIQWFPGHMHKAQKELRKTVNSIDVVIEVADARIPYSSRSPLLEQIVSNKTRLLLLHKADLAETEQTQQWIRRYADMFNNRILVTSTEEPASISKVMAAVRNCPLNERRTGPVRLLVVGIPNVGKSTLINRLAGRTIARTGNEPAVTRAQQQIDIGNNMTLRDSPGVLWPNLEHPGTGYRLAITGAIRQTAMDFSDTGYQAMEWLLRVYRARLVERYGIEDSADTLSALETLGRKHGCLQGGRQVDLERASRVLINDIRTGRLGRLTLESPAQIDAEHQELLRIRMHKQSRKRGAKQN